MRKETILKALAVLPCTRRSLGEKLGHSESWGRTVGHYLVKHRYATENGRELTATGSLSGVLHATGKQPT